MRHCPHCVVPTTQGEWRKDCKGDLLSFTDPTPGLSPSSEAQLPSELQGSEAVLYAGPFPLAMHRLPPASSGLVATIVERKGGSSH